MITLRFDGSFISISKDRSAHSGIMVYAWVVERDGVEILCGSDACAHPTYAGSHQAEMRGLIEGLKSCIALGFASEHIQVCGDSQSLILQMSGESKVSSHKQLDRVFQKALGLASQFEDIEWVWEPRENNYRADTLCKDTLWLCKSDRESFSKVTEDLRYCEKQPSRIHSYPHMGKPVVPARAMA